MFEKEYENQTGTTIEWTWKTSIGKSRMDKITAVKIALSGRWSTKSQRSGKHCESMEKRSEEGEWESDSGESRMASRARQGFVEDESRSKTKSRRKWEMEWKDKIDHRDSRN